MKVCCYGSLININPSDTTFSPLFVCNSSASLASTSIYFAFQVNSQRPISPRIFKQTDLSLCSSYVALACYFYFNKRVTGLLKPPKMTCHLTFEIELSHMIRTNWKPSNILNKQFLHMSRSQISTVNCHDIFGSSNYTWNSPYLFLLNWLISLLLPSLQDDRGQIFFQVHLFTCFIFFTT